MIIYLILFILFFVLGTTLIVLFSLIKILPSKEIDENPIAIMEYLKKIKNRIIENNILLSGAIVILVFFIFFISIKIIGKPKDFGEGILVEMAGMLLDAILLLFLFNLLQELREKKLSISRYNNEIDDFRGWDEKEAMYRIIGNVKRLVKSGVKKIDLRETFLNDSFLHEMDLSGSIFFDSKMINMRFEEVELRNSIFIDANLKGAYFFNCNLEKSKFDGAYLKDCSFENVILDGADFSRANISETDFQGLDISKIKFHYNIVPENWFSKLDKMKITGVNEVKEKYEIVKSNMNEERFYLKLKKKKTVEN